ncbi:rCG30106 [Rattus norvegicus]|uniref:RCG30106 n=1 Tax=Rattus norvegicus TaxID=10116 RepID=A6IMX3_RAT|nr:rCG30106 [Rattus norvegicus]
MLFVRMSSVAGWTEQSRWGPRSGTAESPSSSLLSDYPALTGIIATSALTTQTDQISPQDQGTDRDLRRIKPCPFVLLPSTLICSGGI